MQKKLLLLLLFSIGVSSGCKRDSPNPDGVPNEYVYFSDNIYNGQYPNLLNALGWMYVGGGYDGILLYCQSPGNTYLAYDMGCPYDCQTNSKAIISVLTGNIQAKCPVCGTIYSLYSGAPLSGPGNINLKQYYTQFNDPYLSVSSSPF